MKNLINSVQVKLALKSLAANGSLKNLHLKVGGNNLTVGEVTFTDNNKDIRIDVSFSKEAGGGFEISGDHDHKLTIKDLTINGDGGQEFSIEHLELNSIGEAMELFASIMK